MLTFYTFSCANQHTRVSPNVTRYTDLDQTAETVTLYVLNNGAWCHLIIKSAALMKNIDATRRKCDSTNPFFTYAISHILRFLSHKIAGTTFEPFK